MKFRLFYKNFLIILAIDILILAVALFSAYLVRFDFDIPHNFFILFLHILPVALLIKITCFYFFDLYSGMWRYTSTSDLINIVKAATISLFLLVCYILLRYRFIGFPRSVFLIDWCFAILFIAGFRLCIRLYYEHFSEGHPRQVLYRSLSDIFKQKHAYAKKLLIVGAGDCGEKIYREIRDNASLRYRVVGFLDDNPAKVKKKIHGIPVLGRVSEIGAAAKKVKADEALIAIPSLNGQQMRRIVQYCTESELHYKTMPGYAELINGRVKVSSIRDIDYQDLVGRELIKLDEEKIGNYLNAKRVLVTGAGGSIGSELCRQISRFRPESIVLYERAETPLHEVELELQAGQHGVRIVPILADLLDENQLEKAFELNRPQIVFHAAAYKHVPMLEQQPWKAVDNNVLGTQKLVRMSARHNIERFVYVSTDKAVRPTSIMGATKQVAEMMIQGQNACGISQTRFIIVRFGNVIGSAGSVVPLFKRQIKMGGPVTVTHPDVMRYFMTIPESCMLTLQAAAMGNGGEIFLLDMGTPIKILDMAHDLIRLSGLEPDVDIKIAFIGLRPGEKLCEELITEGEGIVATSHENIMVLKGATCDLSLLNGKIEELASLAKLQDRNMLVKKLQEIVPEYQTFKGTD
ncbi:MAG: polysaccharide biosynthesis protein [Deltaproteobacteria bacterium]|nr:polysaccharide biosynthesis protein [Deltaproteobacteria bacterium]